MSKNNPFIYEQFATGDSFCGRGDELEELVKRCSNNKNTLLISQRRYGKSSLIKELFERLPKKKYLPIYVDLFPILSAMDFARDLYEAVIQALPWSHERVMRDVVQLFRKMSLDISPNAAGDGFKYRPAIVERDFDEYLTDALDGVEAVASKSGLTAVFAFDEFQQIATVKDTRIDAILRKHMQERKSRCFIFSGSKRHMLRDLFLRQSQPLYKMASTLELSGVDEKTFYQFVSERLKQGISEPVFHYLYTEANGESKLIQHIAYHLFDIDEPITEAQVQASIDRILNEDDALFRGIFDDKSVNQKIALKGIALYNGRGLASNKTLHALGISKPSMQTALNSLKDAEEIDMDNKQWFIIDRTYHLWLLRLYG